MTRLAASQAAGADDDRDHGDGTGAGHDWSHGPMVGRAGPGHRPGRNENGKDAPAGGMTVEVEIY
jgi:hypothetical protein